MAIARTPDKPALVAHRADREGLRRFTYRELGDRVARAAGGLRALGVGKMRLMASPRKMPSMTGFGLEICGYLTLDGKKI